MKLILAAILVLNLQRIATAQPTSLPTTSVPTTLPTTQPSPVIVQPPPLLPAPLPPQPLPQPLPQPAAQPKGLEIRDTGHFFDAETLTRANARIEEIRRRFGKQVIIETYDAIPDDRKQRFGQVPKDDFFQEWLKGRAKARDADGVFILICRNPGHLQMAAGSKTRERAYTAENIRELNEVMTASFRKHEYDLGLMRGLNQIEQRMEKNLGPR